MEYTVLATIKHNSTYYNAGDSIELEKDEAQSLLDQSLIRSLDPGYKKKYEEAHKQPPPPPSEDNFTIIKGVGSETNLMIKNLGIKNFEDLGNAEPELLAEIPGITEAKAKVIIRDAAKKAKSKK